MAPRVPRCGRCSVTVGRKNNALPGGCRVLPGSGVQSGLAVLWAAVGTLCSGSLKALSRTAQATAKPSRDRELPGSSPASGAERGEQLSQLRL